MKNIILPIIVILVLGSCTKEAKIKLPPAEEKLVVSCFISPDYPYITVTVSSAKAKFNPNMFGPSTGSGDIDNATVIISDGTNAITVPYSVMGYYNSPTTNFPIVEGRTYFLTVSTPNGKQVDATTTVPVGHLSIESLKINKRKDQPKELDYDIGVIVNDIPNRVNYVAVNLENFSDFNGHISAVDTLRTGGSFIQFYDTDERQSKTQYYFSSSSSYYHQFDTINYVRVTAEAINCSKDLYLFNKSAMESSNIGGNPFADPVLVYTNMNGGFGCFGSYTINRQSQRVR